LSVGLGVGGTAALENFAHELLAGKTDITTDAVIEALCNGTLDGLVEGASAGALTAFFNRLAAGARTSLPTTARGAETVGSEMPAV